MADPRGSEPCLCWCCSIDQHSMEPSKTANCGHPCDKRLQSDPPPITSRFGDYAIARTDTGEAYVTIDTKRGTKNLAFIYAGEWNPVQVAEALIGALKRRNL